jgi:hypothetical protein
MWGHSGRAIRRGRLVLAAFAAGAASAGCAVPSYHLPAGFSSSYQRQIYGLDPAPPPIDGGLAALSTKPGIFYPETAFRETPSVFDDSSPGTRGPAGPLILGQDPLSPPPKVAAKPPDNF